MSIQIDDAAIDEAVRRLASLKGKSLTETIREAVEHEYQREYAKLPLVERLKPIWEFVEKHSGPNGLPADKAFYDELSGEF